MKQGDLLRVELCGPESNPKESGEFHTIEGGVKHSAFYNSEHGKWYEYEPIDHILIGYALYPEEVFPDIWLKPVGKTQDEIKKEALLQFIQAIQDEFKPENWDYLYFIADRVVEGFSDEHI